MTNDHARDASSVVLQITVKTAYAKKPNIFMMRLQRPYGLCLVQITTPMHHKPDQMDTVIRLVLDPKHHPMLAAFSLQQLLRIRTHSSHLRRLSAQYQKECHSPVSSHLYRQPSKPHR